MSITLDGTNGITTPALDSTGGSTFTTLSASTSLTTPLVTNAGTLALSATGANIVTASTNGAERLRITSAGTLSIPRINDGSFAFFLRPVNNFDYEIGSDSGGQNKIRFADSQVTIFENAGGERARIDASGNFLVNRTSATIAGATARFAINGNSLGEWVAGFNNTRSAADGNSNFIVFAREGTQTGSIANSGTTTAYNTSSDYRLKEDVQPMVGSVDRLMALKPVNFAWKVDGSRVDGFLAHEAQEVVPECVTGEKDAVDDEGNPQYQGIDQSKIVPLLTAALQEALTKIEALEARVAALETNA
jgi:hypothetical protein